MTTEEKVMSLPKQIRHRFRDNMAILTILEAYLRKHPEMRFIQLLWALDIINKNINKDVTDKFMTAEIEDRFHEESNITLKKIEQCLSSMKSEDVSGTG